MKETTKPQLIKDTLGSGSKTRGILCTCPFSWISFASFFVPCSSSVWTPTYTHASATLSIQWNLYFTPRPTFLCTCPPKNKFHLKHHTFIYQIYPQFSFFEKGKRKKLSLDSYNAIADLRVIPTDCLL